MLFTGVPGDFVPKQHTYPDSWILHFNFTFEILYNFHLELYFWMPFNCNQIFLPVATGLHYITVQYIAMK